MLYLTRYLTKAHRADYKDELPDGMSALMIPNAEIKEIFETIVIKWFDNSTRNVIGMPCLMRSGTVTARALQER